MLGEKMEDEIKILIGACGIVGLMAIGMYVMIDRKDKENAEFRKAMPIVNTIDSIFHARIDSMIYKRAHQIDSLRKVYEKNNLENKVEE
jgi:hypothetical protein